AGALAWGLANTPEAISKSFSSVDRGWPERGSVSRGSPPAERDREAAKAAQDGVLLPGRVARQAQIVRPIQQQAQDDLGFQPGQRRAQAEVDALPERHVAGRRAADVEPLGGGAPGGVPVG